MNVAGLDLSLARTGVALPGRVFTIEPRGRGPSRLAEIRRVLNREIQHDEVDLAVVEDYPWASSTKGARALAELHGVVMLLLWDLDVACTRVNPTLLKLWATGSGNADKASMIMYARLRWPLEGVLCDDEADALWLADIGKAITRGRKIDGRERAILAKIPIEPGIRRRSA